MRIKPIFGLMAAAALALSACSSSTPTSTGEAPATSGGDTTAKIKVAYVPTTGTNPFWQAVGEGLQQAVDANGNAEIVTVDPNGDQDLMNTQVETLVTQGIDVLVIAPYDTTGVKAALETAAKANVPVVNIDTPVKDQDLVLSVVASDNKKAGQLVAEDMMSKLDKGSKIAILHCPQGQACIDRLDGFKEASGDYFTFADPYDGKGDITTGMELTDNILQSDPDIKAIFGINDPMALGAVKSLEAHPDIKGVLVYGVDGSPDAKKAIEAGTMTGTGAQSPINMGKTAGETAFKILAGETVDHNIVIDVFFIGKDNLSQYSIDGWQ
ncbi:MAG: sugar ABC transporter substrate-binding protein [Propionibacteriaceae bacterium]|jgi:ribose transport system substrate-binding protein|nr:sugar ABC transporter substrate-binding protein [Propionibacteriaceae bacterium]